MSIQKRAREDGITDGKLRNFSRLFAIVLDPEHENLQDVFKKLSSSVPREYFLKADTFLKIEDKVRSLCGIILTAHALKQNYDIDFFSSVIKTNAFGKPYLSEYGGNYYFNIAHAGNCIVCAVDINEIGVDVEKEEAIDLAICDQFFSKEESLYVNSQPTQSGKMNAFFKLWVLKESYIKAKGEGLSIALNSFSFNISSNNDILLSANDSSRWNFKFYPILDGYQLGLCSGKGRLADSLEKVTIYT